VPKKQTIMPGTEYRGDDKRTASQQASDHRRAEVRKLNTETRRKERFQLGLKTMAPKATIFDAVPVGATKHDQGIALALDHPPQNLTPRELLDWRKKMVGFSTFTPAQKRQRLKNAQDDYAASQQNASRLGLDDLASVGETVGKTVSGAAYDVLKKGASYIDPSAIRTSGGQFGPTSLGPKPLPESVVKSRAERALEETVGKGITNALVHGDMPNTFMQGAGLAAGVATLGPAGKIGRAGFVGGKLAFDAIKAEQGIKAAIEAGRIGGNGRPGQQRPGADCAHQKRAGQPVRLWRDIIVAVGGPHRQKPSKIGEDDIVDSHQQKRASLAFRGPHHIFACCESPPARQ